MDRQIAKGMTELCLCVVSEGQSEQHESWLQLRGGDQINNSPEEREEQEREQEDEGLTQEVFITGPPRLPACSPFLFFLSQTIQLMY